MTEKQPNITVQVSPEVSESTPSVEVIIQTASELAKLLNKYWPQITQKNGESVLHYALSGSLGVALIADATQLYDENGNYMISDLVKNKLRGAIHLIHDIDHIRLSYPWPDEFDLSYQIFNQSIKRLPGLKHTDLSFDGLYTFTDEKFVTAKTTNGEYIVSRPDSSAAYKLLSVLISNNFLNKPYQLNTEAPILVEAASDIYSKEIVWKKISEVFQAYNSSAKKNFSEYDHIGYMLKRALKDPCLSTELKDLVVKAADISGTKD